MSDEYTSFLQTEIAKATTGRCPNCDTALRPLHCCSCEGCDGCREVAERVAVTEAGEQEHNLTDLQRAIIEHDDDMARLDRSTLPERKNNEHN